MSSNLWIKITVSTSWNHRWLKCSSILLSVQDLLLKSWKWSETVNMSYFIADFHLFRDAQPQGNIWLQETPFTHIMFSLNDGCTFYLWGLKWALKNSSLKGSHDLFVTAAEPNDGGPSTFLGFIFISQYQSLTHAMVGLVSCKGNLEYGPFDLYQGLQNYHEKWDHTMHQQVIKTFLDSNLVSIYFLLNPDIHSINICILSSSRLRELILSQSPHF